MVFLDLVHKSHAIFEQFPKEGRRRTPTPIGFCDPVVGLELFSFNLELKTIHTMVQGIAVCSYRW
jgi:hypothetical protein